MPHNYTASLEHSVVREVFLTEIWKSVGSQENSQDLHEIIYLYICQMQNIK